MTTLAETNVMVDDLKTMLIKLRPEIDKKEEETKVMVVELEAQQKVAAEQEKVTAVEEAESQKLFNEVMVIKKDCEAELDKAMPIYNDAVKALNTLNKADIVEMKMFTNPPPDVVLVLNAVCLLQGKKENWDESKKLMSNPQDFINSLKEYKKDNIKDSLLKKLRKNYTSNASFVPDNIVKKSAAAKSICMWCIAIDKYSEVLKIIKPKQAALEKSEGELKIAQDELRIKQASLQKVRDHIHQLQANYTKSQRTLDKLQKEKETVETQLERANKLVVGLADEASRWKESVKVLEVDLINLVGNIMLGAGYISYVGTFTSKYRNELLK